MALTARQTKYYDDDDIVKGHERHSSLLRSMIARRSQRIRILTMIRRNNSLRWVDEEWSKKRFAQVAVCSWANTSGLDWSLFDVCGLFRWSASRATFRTSEATFFFGDSHFFFAVHSLMRFTDATVMNLLTQPCHKRVGTKSSGDESQSDQIGSAQMIKYGKAGI